MTYSASELTPIDVIRRMAGDTSNDPSTEMLLDATYTAILARFGVGATAGTATDTAGFYRAAAESLRSVAVLLESRPSSVSAPQDGSVSWTNRGAGLLSQAKSLDAQADALDTVDGDAFWGPTVTVTGHTLTGVDTVVSGEW